MVSRALKYDGQLLADWVSDHSTEKATTSTKT